MVLLFLLAMTGAHSAKVRSLALGQWIRDLCFSQDGEQLLVTGDGGVEIISVPSWQIIYRNHGLAGATIAHSTWNGQFILYSLHNIFLLSKTCTLRKIPVRSPGEFNGQIEVNSDGQAALICGEKSGNDLAEALKIIQLPSGIQIQNLDSKGNYCLSLSSSWGSGFVSAWSDGTLKEVTGPLWAQKIRKLPNGSQPNQLFFNTDARKLIVSSVSGELYCFGTGLKGKYFGWPIRQYVNAAVALDDHHILLGYFRWPRYPHNRGRLVILNTAGGRVTGIWDRNVTSVAFSAKQSCYAYATWPDNRIWIRPYDSEKVQR